MRLSLFLLVSIAAVGQSPDYVRDVAPLLKSRCSGCHGALQQMKGLRLDKAESALAAGSLILTRVSGSSDLPVMPPVGKRLTADEVAVLRKWIEGAPAGAAARKKHWAFEPIAKPAAPVTRTAGWARNEVDAFILARLEREKIQPSGEAEKTTLLRRLSLDLVGLPPTMVEIREYLADARPDAYERTVDRLLASVHFGERWARPWLDRARYADSDGYEKDWVRPWAWRYRDYVINAFNRDMPFDRFTIDQIAGDLLPDATVEQKIATGFHRNTLTNREGGIDNEQFRFESTIDRTNTVSAAWLGLTTGCAQCHDHKYDPIRQKDYFSLFAYFDNVEEADIEAPRAGEMEPYLAKRDEYRATRGALLKEYGVPAVQATWERDMLEAAANPGKRTDWDLAWDCLLKLTEGGWDGARIMRKAESDRTERERDTLTDHFVRNYHFAVGQKKFRELKLPELDKKLTALKVEYPRLSEAMAVAEAANPRVTHLKVRGDYRTDGMAVKPATLAVLPAAQGSTRLDLARWIVSKENPLTARVTVNWIWQEIYGRGIVKSTDDFGTRGDPPSHPELLDWMASRFVEDGWSTKKLIRLMVTSSTYRQSSNSRKDLDAVDPGNALLARQSRLRLPAELIRDNALTAAGLLNTDVGGRSVRPPQPAGVADAGYGKKDSSSWVVSDQRERYRRGLYIHFQRATPYPLLMNFDAPRTTAAVCKRERTNTPLQALNLLNDPVFVEAAEGLAASTTPGDFDALFLRALGRKPTPQDRTRMEAYYTKQRAIRERDPQSIAPWTAVASVLLNLDEFITRE